MTGKSGCNQDSRGLRMEVNDKMPVWRIGKDTGLECQSRTIGGGKISADRCTQDFLIFRMTFTIHAIWIHLLMEVMGMDRAEVDQLRREGIIGEAPEGGAPPSSVPLERQVELGWIVEQDPGYQEFPNRAAQE